MGYDAFYRQSIEEPERFWGEQARLIHWETPPQQILDQSNPPFRRWFVGGTTNLCYNAVDRHLAERGEQLALVAISTETDITQEISYRVLYREVNRFAGILQSLDVGKGDRVVIYMPNMAEAVYAMLACARIGAIHSVVFGGFAAHNLALRIDDAEPKLLICADAGMRGGKVIPVQAAGRRRAGRGEGAAAARADRQPRAGSDDEPGGRARRRLRPPARRAHERRSAGGMAGIERAELPALHLRHHRQAEGHPARRRRLRGGDGDVDPHWCSTSRRGR